MTPPTVSLAFEHASPLARALVGAAVQHVETAGALDDAAELRQAFAAQPTRAAQVQARAWLLGLRLGLPQELARWRLWGGWVALALAVGIALAGLGYPASGSPSATAAPIDKSAIASTPKRPACKSLTIEIASPAITGTPSGA